MHPTWLGFQMDWPVFVKHPFDAANVSWTRGHHFNWQENKVGDRLSEMNAEQLYTLVGLLNSEVKKRTSSAEELKNKRCRQSKIDDKQRGLIRSFLRKNPWITEDFYKFRDDILGD